MISPFIIDKRLSFYPSKIDLAFPLSCHISRWSFRTKSFTEAESKQLFLALDDPSHDIFQIENGGTTNVNLWGRLWFTDNYLYKPNWEQIGFTVNLSVNLQVSHAPSYDFLSQSNMWRVHFDVGFSNSTKRDHHPITSYTWRLLQRLKTNRFASSTEAADSTFTWTTLLFLCGNAQLGLQ